MKSSVNLLVLVGFAIIFAIYALTGSPIWELIFGLGLLGLFLWYFFTDFPRQKRVIGGILTVLLAALCIHALYPRKTNVSDERLVYNQLTEEQVTSSRDETQAILSKQGFISDSQDERVEFPYRLEGSFENKAAFKKTYIGGVGRFYILDGTSKTAAEGETATKFVNIYKFWEPEQRGGGLRPEPKPEDLDTIWDEVGTALEDYDTSKPEIPIERGIELVGGSSFIVKIDRPEGQESNPDDVQQVITTLRKRLDTFGGKELLIATQGEDRLLVQMPGIDDDQRDAIKSIITKPSLLNFHIVDRTEQSKAPQVATGEDFVPGKDAMPAQDPEDGTEGYYLLKKSPDLAGTYVSNAWAALGSSNNWSIMVDFDSEGTDLFFKLTDKNTGEPMAIVLDGVVLSAPNINSAILGTTEISGKFTEQEARSLAASLQNPLRNSLSIENESSVAPAMGKESVKQGFYAAIAGLLATLVFVLIYYRTAGIVSIVGLVITLLFLLGAIAMFGFTLTLPGIAGIILTIGIAVDANVLIYERLKEEIGDGRTLGNAINGAYNKAFSAIFDANITSLITGFILYFVASGPVKGFAVTLIVGILGSMFAALIVTRAIFNWATDTEKMKNLSFWEFIPDNKIDFLGKRKTAVILSAILLLAALAGIAARNEKALGVDFRGGHLFTLQVTDDSITQDSVKTALGDLGLPEPPVVQSQQAIGSNARYITIRMVEKSDKAEAATQVDEVKELLKSSLSLGETADIQIDSVGSAVGKELAISSIMALGLSIVGILLYVTARFEFAFALGAIVALIHDLLITAGVLVLTGHEISLVLVGAFLTIAGYSINDTIVVFDRIRENLKTTTGSVKDVMNIAIRNTLRRTLLTSLTTLLALSVLFLFGGPALRNFSLTIIIGVIIGTYSSIFVAAPFVFWWSEKKKLNLRQQILDAEVNLDTPDRYQDVEDPKKK
ncbi:MAG: protein translocase subunit SecD [Verrucomicrobiales bacterium]